MDLTLFAKRLTLIVATAFLLFAAWPPHMFGPLIFIAFVPLLFYLDSLRHLKKFKRFSLTFIGILLALFLFGYGTSYNAWGEYDDNVHVAALMSVWPVALAISFSSFIKKRSWAFLFLILAWGSIEILQTYWEMNAPLFMIGNGLSKIPSIIQHYSIWGVLGGTMLIIGINVTLFYIIDSFRKGITPKRKIQFLGVLLLPTIISIISFNTYEDATKEYKVALAIGHFDHFKKEFSDNPQLLIDKYNTLLEKVDLENVSLVLFPESAIVNGGWIENLNNEAFKNPLDSLCPGKDIFFGSHMFSIYDGPGKDFYDIRYHEASKVHFKSHNCIVFRDQTGKYSVRSKEKYIPFHESIPYPSLFLFAKNWFNKDAIPTYISKYAKSKDESFRTRDRININPLMCFESTFSDMVTRNKDAHFTLVLANESWNSEERGKMQYVDYLGAKAIESGKGILKVANGGYSGFISSKGKMEVVIDFKEPKAMVIGIPVDDSSSFYSKYNFVFNYITILGAIFIFFYGSFGKFKSH